MLFPQEGEAVPRLRFKGFEGNWELKTIEDVCFSQPSDLTQDSLADLEGQYPVFGASGFIKNINAYHQTEPYIGVVKDGAGVGRIGLYPAYSSILGTMHYLLPKEGYDVRFLAFLLETIDLTKVSSGSTIPHIYYKDYKGINILVPSLDEQKKIGSFFCRIDGEISILKQEHEQLEQMRLACFDSMIIKSGTKKYPSLRFKGFNREWKKIKMNDVFVERHEVSTITDSLPQLSFTIEEGVIRPEDRKTNKRDFLIKDKSTKRYLVTRVDDVIYNPANVIYGAIHKNSLCDGVVSPIYKIFSTDQDASFMECIVRRPSFIQEMTVYMEGTVQKLKTLKPESFLKMTSYIAPTVEEQHLIGEFFNNLNSLIINQQKQLESLKQLRVACLRCLFPDNQSITPPLRFKGFKGEWLIVILKDIMDRFDSLRVPIKESARNKGSVPYYGANGIQDYVDGYTHDGEYILIAEDGANDLSEYPVQYVTGKVWVNNHAHVCAAKNGLVSTLFLKYAISKSDIKSVLVGGTRAKLTSAALMNLSITIPPTLEEQQRIASFMHTLENKITTQSQQVEKLKQLKKACLCQMFE